MSTPEAVANYEGKFKVKTETSDKERISCFPTQNQKNQGRGPTMADRQLISLTELARLLGKGRTTIYEWLYSEQLPPAAKIIKGRRYWTVEQIDDFLNSGQNIK
jgi:predicted DNA-binding transcriptional regulator AlpA